MSWSGGLVRGSEWERGRYPVSSMLRRREGGGWRGRKERGARWGVIRSVIVHIPMT